MGGRGDEVAISRNEGVASICGGAGVGMGSGVGASIGEGGARGSGCGGVTGDSVKCFSGL